MFSNFLGHRYATPEQKKLLLQLAKDNDDIKDMRVKGKHTRAQWAKIVEKLNAIGPVKSSVQWRRTWRSLKYRKHIPNLDTPESDMDMPMDSIISNDSCNSTTPNMSQQDISTPGVLDASASGQSDSQDTLDLTVPEVYDVSDDEDDEVYRRIKEGEAFCSRLIRVVARIMHQGRVVEDVASMRIITMNKLRYLLAANDSTDKIEPEYQMSITDWLLFDTVLVHQHFDVIGMTDTTRNDRSIFNILFKLVVEHDIESLIGDQLAEAWAAVTLAYNTHNRQCTPMLLQRRWYQLKLAARERYLKLWTLQISEGQNEVVEQYSPTPLQEAIVTRYQSLVVAPFIPWKELIKTERVILRERFQSIAMNKKVKEAPIIVNPPTIVESHLTNADMPLIESDTIQQEEQDTNISENIILEARDQRAHTTNTIEANTLENEPSCHEDTPLIAITKVKSEKVIELSAIHDENDDIDDNELCNNECEDTNTRNDIQPLLPFNVTLNVARTPILPTITNIFGNVNVPIESLPKISVMASRQHDTLTDFPIDDVNIDEIQNEDPLRLPTEEVDIKIDEVFKLPNIENTDARYILDGAVKTENTDEAINDVLIPECLYESKLNICINDESQFLDNITMAIDSTADDYCINDILSNEETLINNFNDDIDLNLDKDSLDILSIHNENIDTDTLLLDDGIEVPNDMFTHETGTMDVDTDHNHAENRDNPGIIKEINRIPVVLTVKLDDMGLLPIQSLEHVYSKKIIDLIHLKSKPVLKQLDTKLKSKQSKKVKLSSNLFKKPLYCTYKHTKLRKNPDFHINYKKLSWRFLLSSQNRLLLESCKAVTVDVSKEFESRLVNGVMYLDTNEMTDIHNNVLIKNTSSPATVQAKPDATSDKTVETNPKSIQDTTNSGTVPYKSDIRLVDQALLKSKEISPSKLQATNSASQTTKNKKELIIIYKSNIENVPFNKDFELHSLNALLSELKESQIRNNNNTRCCWAKHMVHQLTIKSTIYKYHSCPQSSCRCCCKSILKDYYKQFPNLQFNKSIIPYKIPKRNSFNVFENKSLKDIPGNDNPNILRNIVFSNPRNILAKYLLYYEKPQKEIVLGPNKILLTTTQIPQNFGIFLAFRNYLKNAIRLPKGINIRPSGEVVWNRVPSLDITPQFSTKILRLIKDFNQMTEFARQNSRLSSEVKSSLGKLFSKTLNRVIFDSELKYAYRNKGLFFKYDLNTGSLDLINLAINVHRVPLPFDKEFILPD